MTKRQPAASFRWPTTGELRWAAVVAAAVMLITALPYLWGLAIRPSGHYYSGLLTNPDEHNVYLAYMRQAADGHVFFVDPFTSEPQRGRVVNVLFLALGILGRVAHLPLPIVYHLARLVSGWLLLMAIYCLAAQTLKTTSGRRIALLLAATAAGFGWLFHAQGGQPHPIDYGPGLVMPEAVTFLTILLNPLFSLSVFLLIAVIGLGAHAVLSGSARAAGVAGAAALVLGNIHTYDLMPAAAVLLASLAVLVAQRRLKARGVAMALVIAAIAMPSLAYQLWLMHSGDVTLIVKSAETPVLSPPPRYFALGLGLPLLLGIVGAGRAAMRGPDGARLAALWLVLGFALVYAPHVPFQRKLAEGVQVPACILAVFALEPLWTRGAGWRAAFAGGLVVLLSAPSNALYVQRALRDLATNNREYIVNLMPPLYLRQDQYQALRSLGERASLSDVLLCNSFLGSYAPSLAGTRVYVGHWAETLHFPQKLEDFSAFLREDTPQAFRESLVRDAGITYLLRDESVYDAVFLPPAERSSGGFMPSDMPQFEQVFHQGLVTVWKWRPG